MENRNACRKVKEAKTEEKKHRQKRRSTIGSERSREESERSRKEKEKKNDIDWKRTFSYPGSGPSLL